MPPLSKRGAPRLLKTVGGADYARKEDYEDDIDADPESSSAGEEEKPDPADMQMNFAQRFTQAKKAEQPKTEPKRQSSRRKAIEDVKIRKSPKRQKLSDDEDTNIFGEIERRRKKMRKDFSQPATAKPLGLTQYGKPKPKREFITPYTVEVKRPPQPTKSESWPTSTSFGTKPNGSSQLDDELDGIEEYVSDLSDAPSLKSLKEPSKDSKAKKGSKNSKNSKTTNSLRTSQGSQGAVWSSPPQPKVPEFRMPMTYTQVAPELAKLTKEDLHDPNRTPTPEPEPEVLPTEGDCPMKCGKVLSRVELEKLDERANIRQMQEFCRNHQVRDAKEAWEERKFPTIHWNGLKGRLGKYYRAIKKMIKNPDDLYFREEMAERVKTGKDRNIMQHLKSEGLDSIGVGYYGPKGLDIIMDYITHTFSADIRARAGADKLIAARSPSGYIQMVLVPEVATLMVKDDMNVDAEAARQIMRESNHIGDLLNANDEAGRREILRGRAEYVELDD